MSGRVVLISGRTAILIRVSRVFHSHLPFCSLRSSILRAVRFGYPISHALGSARCTRTTRTPKIVRPRVLPLGVASCSEDLLEGYYLHRGVAVASGVDYNPHGTDASRIEMSDAMYGDMFSGKQTRPSVVICSLSKSFNR